MIRDNSKYHHLFNLETDSVASVLEKMDLNRSNFINKTCLITGAARGIGKQIAIGLSHQGCHVIIIDKRKEGADVASNINKLGKAKCHFIHADISDRSAIEEAIESAQATCGKIDYLINNAVHFTIDGFNEMSIEEWTLHQRTNIDATVILTKLLLPEMLKSKSGVIINMIALEGMAFAAAMSSSKVAMRSLVFSLSSEIPADAGVSIFGFAPGLVATPLVEDVFVKYCDRMDLDFEDYVDNFVHNPGYKGLMPAEHCAAALIYSLCRSNEFNGLIADPFHALDKFDIIDIHQPKSKHLPTSHKSSNVHRLGQYINEITHLNDTIESKILERTKNLHQEKEAFLGLLKEIENKNKELESIRDELIEAKERVEQASKHKETFFTNVTHEIRTPLNAILGFVDLVLDSNLDEEQRDHLNAVQISGENLLRLVNEVLDISKISTGKFELEMETFNVSVLLSDLERINRGKALIKNNKLNLKIEEGLPQLLYGDAIRLHQILINLLGNAIKFTENGIVEISVHKIWEDKEEIKLSFKVSDTGPGIPEESQKNIFETFTQVKGERDRTIGGSGLGLAIVKQLVSLKNGIINLKSKEGEGTTFTVNLVYAKSDLSSTTMEKNVPIKSNALKGCHILLAEDNQFNKLLEQKVLEKLGAKITIAENGLEVLELLKNESFDLILMDIQMPKMDGIEATKVIRGEMHMGTPIVALTANAFKQELDQCLAVGMNDFITKPFKKEHLVHVILNQIRTKGNS